MKRWKGLVLMFVLAAAPVGADSGRLARQIKVYVHRPHVFADQYLGLGIPENRALLESQPWYVRIDESIHAVADIDSLADYLRRNEVPGLDFTGDRYISNGEMERLLAPAGLEHLHLLRFPGTPLLDDQILPTIGKLYDLQVLELNDRVTDRGIAFLKDLKNLKIFSASGPGVTDQSMPILAALPVLKRVRLEGTRVTDHGLELLTHLPLHELALGSSTTDRGLEIAARVPTLTRLELGEAQVTGRGLTVLSQVPGIHTLFLGPSITDADLPALLLFKNLKRLDLTGARLTDKAADVLGHMTQLEELALTDTQVGRSTLEALSRLPHLRYLEVSHTQLVPDDFKSLAALPSLQVLSFSSKHRLHAKDLEGLGRWPHLHGLLVNGVLLGPRLIESLRKKHHVWSEGWFVAIAEAAEGAEDADLEQALVVASQPVEERPHPFHGVTGLERIHQAEASLEDVSAAPSNPTADTFQENEKNFLGEITVNATPQKKHH